MINKVDSIDSVERIKDSYLKGKSIVLYGTHRYSDLMKKYLKRIHGIEISVFAISKGEDIPVEDVPVRFINDIKNEALIIICVPEQKQASLIEKIRSLGFSNVFVVLNDFIRYIEAELQENRLEIKEKISFEVHITEHCNLNCKGCYHFSPLAKDEFLSEDEFEKDIKRLAELSNGEADRITLLGGEPLLHPNICEFIEISRSYFPSCNLELLTNGILLLNMPEEFWKCGKKNNLALYCTRYPIPLDYGEIEKKAKENGLTVGYHNDISAGEKTLIKYPFDITGNQDAKWNFEHCTRSNLCTTLKHGRIFPCPMAAHAHLAKNYFGLDIELSQNDSIDIYKSEDMKEIMEFLTKPIPFCKYCNLRKRPEQISWERSRFLLNEWF